ncbi:MAG: 16S rRNA (cytosine(1402)-N(4))-methyltransferase RsmH [Lachnospiraceae bacterium]
MEFVHKPVLLEEVLEGLAIKQDGIYADGTMGGAGNGFKIYEKLGTKGSYIGIDQDADAVSAGTEKLHVFGSKVTIIRENYSDMVQALNRIGIEKVDGILLDLGVSSYQLDTAERGFSYRMDAPLDMRMDNRQELTAADVVNTYPENRLFHIIRDYGEDKFAKNIAKHIVAERARKPILTTGRLAEIASQSVPMKFKKRGGNPAKRTFQAVRIEVNHELDVLSGSINGMIDILKPGGRICIITFHSLEDRIVKQAFRKAENPCTCPPDFPVCVCGNISKGKVGRKNPVIPGEQEMEQNPRSKSAKLRVFRHN